MKVAPHTASEEEGQASDVQVTITFSKDQVVRTMKAHFTYRRLPSGAVNVTALTLQITFEQEEQEEKREQKLSSPVDAALVIEEE